MLAGLSADKHQDLLTRIPPGLAAELSRLGENSPDTAGQLMDPRVLAVRPHTTVREALALVLMVIMSFLGTATPMSRYL